MDREDVEPAAGHEVARDGAVDPAAQQEERLLAHRHIPMYFAYRERARWGSSVPRMSARPSEKIVITASPASNTRTEPRDFTGPSGRSRASIPAKSISPLWAGSMEIVWLPQSAAMTWPRFAPRYSVSRFTHAGQSFRRLTRSRWSSFAHPSKTRSSPLGLCPRRSLIPSVAWRDPTIEETVFRIPAVSHVGRDPGGGICGRKHRKHAVVPGRMPITIPCVAIAPP